MEPEGNCRKSPHGSKAEFIKLYQKQFKGILKPRDEEYCYEYYDCMPQSAYLKTTILLDNDRQIRVDTSGRMGHLGYP